MSAMEDKGVLGSKSSAHPKKHRTLCLPHTLLAFPREFSILMILFDSSLSEDTVLQSLASELG